MKLKYREVLDRAKLMFGEKAFRIAAKNDESSQFNAALYDVEMYIAANTSSAVTSEEAIVKMKKLLKDPDFVSAISKSTSDEASVKRRFSIARQEFSFT